MNTRYLIWILVAMFALVVIISNARMQFKSSQKEVMQQHIEEAFITLAAPKLEKKTLNEEAIKENLKDSASYLSAYGIFYKKTEYSVIFTHYTSDFDLPSSSKAIISLFENDNFIYETNTEKTESDERMTLSGTFKKNELEYGIEVLYIKRDFYFWQILTVYPYSQENAETAKNFISSVKTDDKIIIKDKTEEKSK